MAQTPREVAQGLGIAWAVLGGLIIRFTIAFGKMLTFVEDGFGWGLVAVESIVGLLFTPFNGGLAWGFASFWVGQTRPQAEEDPTGMSASVQGHTRTSSEPTWDLLAIPQR